MAQVLSPLILLVLPDRCWKINYWGDAFGEKQTKCLESREYIEMIER